MQRHVDSGRDGRRRHRVAVVDEPLLWPDVDGRIEFGKLSNEPQ